jgi:hypothetical protein
MGSNISSRKSKRVQTRKKAKINSPLDKLEELYGPFNKNPRPAPEFIYVTKAPFGCKIGRTTRPELRPLQVAGNAPVQLEVLIVKEVANSYEIERRIHDHFKYKWLRGEWFSLDDSDVQLIRDVLDGNRALPEPVSEDGSESDGEIPF